MEPELNGLMVIVHHAVTYDRAGRAGQVGAIVAADVFRDDFYVQFDDGEKALFAANALLVLRSSNEIYRHLQHNSSNISSQDFMNLKNIALLQDYGTAAHIKVALQLTQKYESLREQCLSGLEETVQKMMRPGRSTFLPYAKHTL